VRETLREKHIVEGLSLKNWDQQGGTAAKCQNLFTEIIAQGTCHKICFQKEKTSYMAEYVSISLQTELFASTTQGSS
jgi:hypothetical protein